MQVKARQCHLSDVMGKSIPSRHTYTSFSADSPGGGTVVLLSIIPWHNTTLLLKYDHRGRGVAHCIILVWLSFSITIYEM